MATRSTLVRLGLACPTGLSRLGLTRSAESARGAARCFSEGKGRVLSEEERAKESVYIQKMEREKLAKLKLKAEKEKAEKDKEGTEKKSEESKP